MTFVLSAAEAYPLLDRRFENRPNGGAGVQLYLLSRELVKLGHSVIHLVPDIGQGDVKEIDGIRFVTTYPEGTHLPEPLFQARKVMKTFAGLRASAGDVYIQTCACLETGFMAQFCRKRRKRFIFRVAHDFDCIPEKLIVRNPAIGAIYTRGLRRAHAVVAQSAQQQKLLLLNFGVASTLIRSAVHVPPPVEAEPKSIDVLWVGNVRPMKRPELVFEMARKLPHRKFTVVGCLLPGQERYFAKLKAGSGLARNVSFTGQVPYHRVGDYFSACRILVNTSETEGFPNTFLQAWARGVPVVSFFDPDGLISNLGLGVVACDVDGMARAVERLLCQDQERQSLGRNGRAYVAANHDPALVARAYLSLAEGHDGV